MDEVNDMTLTDALLEQIAQRIEREAITPEQAAAIVRSAKTTSEDTQRTK